MSTEPTSRMKRLYHYLVEHRWGEPADLIVFDGTGAQTPGALDVVHVAIWDAGGDCDVTTFASLGMSEQAQPGADYRVELTLGYRGPLPPEVRRQLVTFVANVTEYPFMHRRKLDWWERLANPGAIPGFPDCTQVLLAPMFGADEFRTFPEPDSDVKLLAMVPITPHENHILADHGSTAFLDYCEREGVDIFAPRADKP
jgi:hypothetical protein